MLRQLDLKSKFGLSPQQHNDIHKCTDLTKMFYGIVLYVYFFLPGLINDMRLVKSFWVLDEAVISMTFAFVIYNGYAWFWEYPIQSIFGIVIGMQLAGLERFLVGWFFHSIKSIEKWHNLYHDQLLQRLVTKEYYISDHFLELTAYAAISFIYISVFTILGLDAFEQNMLWIGILAEHYFGLKIRLRIQYGSIKSFDGTPFCTFIRNAFAFYWYHIVKEPHTCLGFSSPWFDTQKGSNPFESKWTFSSPLPFIDFFFVDYSEEYDLLLREIIKRYPLAAHQIPDVYSRKRNRKLE